MQRRITFVNSCVPIQMDTAKIVTYTIGAPGKVYEKAKQLNVDVGAALVPIVGDTTPHTAVGSWVLTGLIFGVATFADHSRGISDANEQFARNTATIRALERVAIDPRPGETPIVIDLRTLTVQVLGNT